MQSAAVKAEDNRHFPSKGIKELTIDLMHQRISTICTRRGFVCQDAKLAMVCQESSDDDLRE